MTSPIPAFRNVGKRVFFVDFAKEIENRFFFLVRTIFYGGGL